MIETTNTVVIHVAKYLDGNDRLCHHDCLFCIERMEPGYSNGLLPSISAIDLALSHYVKVRGRIYKVYIAGGEPTLRSDFKDIVNVVYQYCENIVVSTSCDFDEPDNMIEIIGTLGIKCIATSIHSHFSKVHDILTGSRGSFDRTISSIRKFISKGVSVTVNSVINLFNILEMKDIIECFQLRDINIEKLTLTHYINHGNAFYHNELKFNIDDYHDSVSKALNILGDVNYDVTFRDFPICIDERLSEHQEHVEDIDIINLNVAPINIECEKAPSFIKNKCYRCKWFEKCPHYLIANYGEV